MIKDFEKFREDTNKYLTELREAWNNSLSQIQENKQINKQTKYAGEWNDKKNQNLKSYLLKRENTENKQAEVTVDRGESLTSRVGQREDRMSGLEPLKQRI